jgi:hypothetical protein
MTSTRPALLTPPPLEAYPFIDVMFRQEMVGIAHKPYGASDRSYLKNVFNDTSFKSPDSLRLEQIAPLQAMNEATLDRLLYILRPKLYGASLTTKADFDQTVLDAYDRHIHHMPANTTPCRLEQMASFQLAKAYFTEPADWGQMADLYNESSADQQEAIHQLFVNIMNIKLKELFATPAPKLKLAESLSEAFESKIENGETFFYSEVEKQWLRQASFQQIYRVTISLKGSSDPCLLVATAPTSKQAIALASIYAQTTDDLFCPGNKITIHHNLDEVATADLVPSGVSTINSDRSEIDTLKLVWDFPNVGAFTGHDKTIRDNLVTQIENCSPSLREGLEREHREICRQIHSRSSDTPETFTKAVLSVERTLGLQWSKVQLLEDALGL